MANLFLVNYTYNFNFVHNLRPIYLTSRPMRPEALNIRAEQIEVCVDSLFHILTSVCCMKLLNTNLYSSTSAVQCRYTVAAS